MKYLILIFSLNLYAVTVSEHCRNELSKCEWIQYANEKLKCLNHYKYHIHPQCLKDLKAEANFEFAKIQDNKAAALANARINAGKIIDQKGAKQAKKEAQRYSAFHDYKIFHQLYASQTKKCFRTGTLYIKNINEEIKNKYTPVFKEIISRIDLAKQTVGSMAIPSLRNLDKEIIKIKNKHQEQVDYYYPRGSAAFNNYNICMDEFQGLYLKDVEVDDGFVENIRTQNLPLFEESKKLSVFIQEQNQKVSEYLQELKQLSMQRLITIAQEEDLNKIDIIVMLFSSPLKGREYSSQFLRKYLIKFKEYHSRLKDCVHNPKGTPLYPGCIELKDSFGDASAFDKYIKEKVISWLNEVETNQITQEIQGHIKNENIDAAIAKLGGQ